MQINENFGRSFAFFVACIFCHRRSSNFPAQSISGELLSFYALAHLLDDLQGKV
jgi:hypothetical protein